MDELRTNSNANNAASADVPRAEPLDAENARRVCGNPAALKKAVFASRDTRAVGLQASIGALMLMDRLRFIRTLDLAFHLYADRTFTAALAAANNLLKRLTRNGFVTAHITRVGGQRIYGCSQRGVNFLRDQTGHEGKAHRSLRDVKNPEHRLWANLIVITAEARGLTAMTESEVLRYERKNGEVVRDDCGVERVVPRKLLTIENPRRPGERKGLTPDALLMCAEGERVWTEVDASKRSSGRAKEILALVAKIGTQLCEPQETRLVLVVIFARTHRIYTHITGLLRKQATAQVEPATTYLKPAERESAFEVWYHPSIADDRPSKPAQDFRCGRVQVQMLPDIRNKGEGWYDQDWLPYAQHVG